MRWQMLNLVPQRLLECPPAVCVGLIACGIVLWIAGSTFSRPLITLLAVAIGTLAGLHLPVWMGWKIDGMGMGVGGALLLGLSGYLLHRTWIGIGLASILAILCGAAVWFCVAPAARLPALQWNGDMAASLGLFRRSLPEALRVALPVACLAGLSTGALCGIFWPKVSTAAMYSLLGLTLIAMMAAILRPAENLRWLNPVSGQRWALVILFSAVATVGAWIQLRIHRGEPENLDSQKAASRKPEKVRRVRAGAAQAIGV